jgi:hypothetical protein
MADAVVKAFKLMHHHVAHYDRLKRTLNVSKAAQSRVFIERLLTSAKKIWRRLRMYSGSFSIRNTTVAVEAQSGAMREAAGPDSGIAHGARGSTFKFCRNSYTSQNPEVITLRKRLDKLTPPHVADVR